MTNALDTGGMQWQLRAVLERYGLTSYRLAQQLKGQLSEGSVYALARGETQRVSLSTLGHLIHALEELTGQRLTAADLLEYTPLPVQPPSFQGDPTRAAFDSQKLKRFSYRPRADRPTVPRPSEELIREMRDGA